MNGDWLLKDAAEMRAGTKELSRRSIGTPPWDQSDGRPNSGPSSRFFANNRNPFNSGCRGSVPFDLKRVEIFFA
jgi:hypothetical protein